MQTSQGSSNAKVTTTYHLSTDRFGFDLTLEYELVPVTVHVEGETIEEDEDITYFHGTVLFDGEKEHGLHVPPLVTKLMEDTINVGLQAFNELRDHPENYQLPKEQ